MADEFDLEIAQGLSQEEVSLKIKKEGYNELPSADKRSFFTIVLEVIREPMFLLLIACGTIYLFLGDLQEALMLDVYKRQG